MVEADTASAVVRAALRRARALRPLVLTGNLANAAGTANAATARRVLDAHVLRWVALRHRAQAVGARQAATTAFRAALPELPTIGRIAGAAVAIAVATVPTGPAPLSVGLALRFAAAGADARRALALAGELGSTAAHDGERHRHSGNEELRRCGERPHGESIGRSTLGDGVRLVVDQGLS